MKKNLLMVGVATLLAIGVAPACVGVRAETTTYETAPLDACDLAARGDSLSDVAVIVRRGDAVLSVASVPNASVPNASVPSVRSDFQVRGVTVFRRNESRGWASRRLFSRFTLADRAPDVPETDCQSRID